MRKFKLFIVDDHPIFRNGLKQLIGEIDIATVEGEASSGEEFLEKLDHISADIVLMDIRMPGMGGLQATAEAIRRNPQLNIIALSMFDEVEYVKQMFDSGARGYLSKSVSKEEMRKAILKVADENELYYAEGLQEELRQHLSDAAHSPEHKPTNLSDIKLTKRGRQILEMVCNGMTNEDISKSLHLSTRTIEGHRMRLMHKIGATNTAHLIKLAVTYKLIDIVSGR